MSTSTLSTMLWLAVAWLACNDPAKQPPTDNPVGGRTDTLAKAVQPPTPPSETAKPPIINLLDTVSMARLVLYIKDSAATIERVGLKLGEIYGPRLGKCLASNKLTMTGPPMAWYKSEKAPYFFEAGVPVDKRPTQLPKGIMIREIPAGPVMVARFFGPYNLMGIGYEAARERLKSTQTETAGAPYEVYIGDPMVIKDPYKVQTDIVFPIKPTQQ